MTWDPTKAPSLETMARRAKARLDGLTEEEMEDRRLLALVNLLFLDDQFSYGKALSQAMRVRIQKMYKERRPDRRLGRPRKSSG